VCIYVNVLKRIDSNNIKLHYKCGHSNLFELFLFQVKKDGSVSRRRLQVAELVNYFYSASDNFFNFNRSVSCFRDLVSHLCKAKIGTGFCCLSSVFWKVGFYLLSQSTLLSKRFYQRRTQTWDVSKVLASI
jgi:hypothetical protein